jgi:hypothetical protein
MTRSTRRGSKLATVHQNKNPAQFSVRNDTASSRSALVLAPCQRAVDSPGRSMTANASTAARQAHLTRQPAIVGHDVDHRPSSGRKSYVMVTP